MKKSKQAIMHERILRHGENLNRIFHTDLDPIILCKKLRRLETKASQICLDYCNGDIESPDDSLEPIADKIDNILHYRKAGIPVFINRDPRGYALKIQDEYVRDNNITIERDWGGYGLLAPDFSES